MTSLYVFRCAPNGTVHVVPKGEPHHVLAAACPCGTRIEPTAGNGIVVVHASSDGREGLALALDALRSAEGR